MTASSAPELNDAGRVRAGPARAGPDGTSPDVVGLEGAVAVFIEVRPLLFGIVHRMLGSATEAEDVLQEAWIRWHTTDRSAVRNPQAFLTTTATRLALNVLQSARCRREVCTGRWFPEPAPANLDASTSTGMNGDPTLGAERAEALDIAVLVLLERLTATERAAYVLREAFGYAYGDIARNIRVSQVAARQLVSRARKHLATGRQAGAVRASAVRAGGAQTGAVQAGGVRTTGVQTAVVQATVHLSKRRALRDAFVTAARTGDMAGLEHLFAQDVVSRADDGDVDDGDVAPNYVLMHGAERKRQSGAPPVPGRASSWTGRGIATCEPAPRDAARAAGRLRTRCRQTPVPAGPPEEDSR